MIRRIAVLAVLAALPGCAPGACDPSQAGFLSGIGCEASGSYTTRNRYQQSALAQESGNALQARAAAGEERSRVADALVTRDQARTRLNAIDAETRRLRARLAAARARGTSDSGRLGAAQAELDALQQERSRLGSSTSDADLRALEARRRRAAEAMGGI